MIHTYQFISYSFILLFSTHQVLGQLTISERPLARKINETSGLEWYGNRLVTHNDSGGRPAVYVFDPEGEEIEIIDLAGVQNIDWEDITADQDHYYIGDTGNNYGTRDNQKIYITDAHFQMQDSIMLRYEGQTSFKRRKIHPYDAEALANFGQQLVLFSKDRQDLDSRIYVMEKTPGPIALSAVDTLKVGCLITGADHHEPSGLMALTGYAKSGEQYLFLLPDFEAPYQDKSKMRKFLLPVGPAQIEAIKIIDAHEFWLTSEDEGLGAPRLFKVRLD